MKEEKVYRLEITNSDSICGEVELSNVHCKYEPFNEGIMFSAKRLQS